jgi:hypothetical protein
MLIKDLAFTVVIKNACVGSNSTEVGFTKGKRIRHTFSDIH